MAKYYATETALEIVSAALQMHGGYGYIKEYPIERMYRMPVLTILRHNPGSVDGNIKQY